MIAEFIHHKQEKENIAKIGKPKEEEATIRSIAEERDTAKYVKQNGIWFDPAISERERAVRNGGRRSKSASSNESGVYSS